MSLQEKFEKLQNDLATLDMENIGGWPIFIKAACWALAMVAVIVLTYQLILREESANLQAAGAKEQTLKAEFEQKVKDAANIEAYQNQNKEMTESFSTLLNQLPKDTEVPGLLDDISEKGQTSGLNFEAIDLQTEKKADFYIELPISIKVKGGYHDFGAFVSGVAGLPRIVTLHDFVIASSSSSDAKTKASDKPNTDEKARNSEELSMVITAKTYRYKSSEEADAEKDAAAKAKAAKTKADTVKPAAAPKKAEGAK
jgi:type IV pilus assembly protein PilO